jgi:hypothetical protein
MGVLSRKHGVASSLILGATSLALVSGCGEQGLATAASLSAQAKEVRSTNLTQDEVCLDGDPACTPTGAHGKHGAYLCSVCHKVAGRLVFDKTGPAYATGYPNPTFDATAKTCTNVACHRVPPGTFSYYFGVDGNGDPVLYTVSSVEGRRGLRPLGMRQPDALRATTTRPRMARTAPMPGTAASTPTGHLLIPTISASSVTPTRPARMALALPSPTHCFTGTASSTSRPPSGRPASAATEARHA